MSIGAHVSSSKRFAELRFEDSAGKPVSLAFDTNDLESFIGSLSLARSRMVPAVATKPPADPALRIENVVASAGLDAKTGLPMILFRHPGAGWFTLVLEPATAVRLAKDIRENTEWSTRGPTRPN